MKKILFTVFITLFGFMTVDASNINKVDMTVDIDKNGDGHVTEVWDATWNDKTEMYHSYGQLGNMQIKDLKVKDESGTVFTDIPWNVNASRETKKYKSGINYTNDGLELCWGIGDYGHHIYTAIYTIENLVEQYTDSQILYFSFWPQNGSVIDSYKLTIGSFFEFKDLKYSAYGLNGETNIENGKIVIKSNGNLDSEEYVVSLINFPNETFTLDTSVNKSFEDVAVSAQEGVISSKSDNSNDSLLQILIILAVGGGVIAIITGAAVSSSKKRDQYYNDFTLPNIKEVNNFRDIPYKKDIASIVYMGKRHNLVKDDNVLGTYLLKLIQDKKIDIINTEGGFLDFNKNDNYYFKILEETSESSVETELISYLREAEKEDKITPKQFKKWCSRNYTKIFRWISKVEDEGKNNLIKNKYIIESEEEYAQDKFRKAFTFTDKVKEETIYLLGLKKFLNDMTLIDEKKAIEVHVWNEYLIVAEALGIADKVAKQFKDFKAIDYTSNQAYYDNLIGMSIVSHSFMASAVSARESAISSASSGGTFSGGGFSAGGFSGGGAGGR